MKSFLGFFLISLVTFCPCRAMEKFLSRDTIFLDAFSYLNE